jgi:hypothetical protein
MRDMTFSPDGRLLASTGDGRLRLWEVRTGRLLGETPVLNWDGGWVAFVSQGREIAWTGNGHHIQILDARTLERRAVFPAEPGDSYFNLASSPDGGLVAVNGSLAVSVWDVGRAKPFRLCKELPGRGLATAVAFAPDKPVVAVPGEKDDPVVRRYDLASGKELRRFPVPRSGFQDVAGLSYARDSQFLVVGGMWQSEVWLADPVRGRWYSSVRWDPKPTRERDFPGQAPERALPGVRSLAVSADGKTLAVVGNDGWLRLFEVASEGLRHQGPLGAREIAFSPDGTLLASLDWSSGQVHLWDWRQPRRDRAPRPTQAQMEQLWADLAAEDAARGYQAVARLVASAEQAVLLLGERVRPVPPGSAARLRRLVTELDHDNFEVRQRASAELRKAGDQAEGVLRSALANPASPEMVGRVHRLLAGLGGRRGPRLRFLHVVEVLEALGSPEALCLLDRLAAGDPEALETQDARAARERLAARLLAER